jgi:hypothetical protein
VAVADGRDAAGTLDQLRRSRQVVVGGAGPGRLARQQPAVEHAGGDHRDAALLAQRQQHVQRRGVQQGVAAGQQHHVHVGVQHQVGEHLPLVHPRADGADHPGRAELVQGRVGRLDRLTPVVVRVVQQRDVDAAEPEPLQAGVQRPPHAVGAEVPDALVGGRHVEPLGVPAGARLRDEYPADLGRQHVLVPGAGGQRAAEPPLRQAEAVVGGGVEEAHARPPGGADRAGGVPLADRPVQVPDRGAAEAERRHRHATASQRRGAHHRLPLPGAPPAPGGGAAGGRSRSPCMPPSIASAVPVVAPASGLAR